MQRPLDSFSFKKNVYERPNQKWICGHAAEGRACPLGPDARGSCRHTGECIPAKKGDRWMCTRAEPLGGKCEEGPLSDGACSHPIPPCQPLCSLRRLRGLYVWLFAGLTSGALLILFGGYSRHAWMDPGALTNAHGTSATRCSDCHSLEARGAKQLISVSLGERAREDSMRCLKCHQLGGQPFRPHGLASAALGRVQKRLAPRPAGQPPLLLRMSHSLAAPKAHGDELACAICHQEHHGRRFDLTRLTNTQCQACHSVQFASFEKGHPEFADYPYARRTRIFFDHNSHLRQHFAEMKAKAPSDCQSCHVPRVAGHFMEVKSFDATCAACHSAQIKGEGMTVKGVAFFTVPGLDVETMAAKGISIGEWPKFADGKITPFMQLIMDRQPSARAALQKLQGVDLLDLTKATSDQLAAAERFAWAVKALLFNLVVEGQSYLVKELKGEVALAGLEVPRAALLAAQQEWMPHLLTEMPDYQKGIRPPLPEKPNATPTPAPNDKKPPGDESLVGGEDLTTAATPTPSESGAASGGDLLAGGNEDLTTAASPAPPQPAGEDEDLASGDLSQPVPVATPSPTATPAPTPAAEPAEEWVAAGGWYRPGESFSLFYRPTGHADPFLVAWLNGAAHWHDEAPAAEAEPTFQKMANPEAPGLCLKCHTVDQRSGATVVNWLPAQPNPKDRPFTTFSHTTHFSLVGTGGCKTCHSLNAQSKYARSFTAGSETAHDPTKFQSNFAPISKMLCVKCHQPRIAGDSCVQCHRYHAAPVARKFAGVGRFRISAGEKDRANGTTR